MYRHDAEPRKGWRETVEGQGLTYAVDRAENGDEKPYWHEAAAYELSEDEVEYLEGVTEELHGMALEAARSMLDDPQVMARLGLPPAAAEIMRAGLHEPDPLTLYGRFDLAYGEKSLGPAKLLEYNADTPAGLVEAAVAQWYWLEDVAPERDQWNMLHERLVQAWKRAMPRVPGWVVHFAVGAKEPNEDWATVAYLRDTAREAGLIDLGITMEEIGWHHEKEMFVDGTGLPIKTCFKMYPWEWMLKEDFGRYVLDGASSTTWVEPMWKALLGSKALLPVLWEMFPGHENLLPAYFERPDEMDRYVAKPMFGWEGAGIRVVLDGVEVAARPERHAKGQEYVYQQFTDLPDFDGNYPVLGTWIVGGHAAGLGIRESDGLVTDAVDARFVPHFMDASRSTPEQVARWLEEDAEEDRTTDGGGTER